MTIRTAFAAALIGAAAFSLAAPAGAGPLAKSDIAGLFPGQFEAKVKGYRVSFTGTRSGSLHGVAYGQQDKGRWYMQGSSLCVVWSKWTKGKPHCGQISQKGGWYVATGGSGEVLRFRRTDLAQQ